MRTSASTLGALVLSVLFAGPWTALARAVPFFSIDLASPQFGLVSNSDVPALSIQFGGPPGPSGLLCAGVVPCTH